MSENSWRVYSTSSLDFFSGSFIPKILDKSSMHHTALLIGVIYDFASANLIGNSKHGAPLWLPPSYINSVPTLDSQDSTCFDQH